MFDGVKSKTLSGNVLGLKYNFTVSGTSTRPCASCGNSLGSGEHYCSRCGAQAPPPGKSCSTCQRILDPSERFCSGCGTQCGEVGPSCSKCHSVSDLGSAFCIRCGESLTASSSAISNQGPTNTGPSNVQARGGLSIPNRAPPAAANVQSTLLATRSAPVNQFGQATMLSAQVPRPMMSHQLQHGTVGGFMQPPGMFQPVMQMSMQQSSMPMGQPNFIHRSMPQPAPQASTRPAAPSAPTMPATMPARPEPQAPPRPPNMNPNFNPNFGLAGPPVGGDHASAPPAPPDLAAAMGLGVPGTVHAAPS